MLRRLAVVAAVGALSAVPGSAHGGPDDALAKLLARTNAVAREVSKLRGLPLKHMIPYDVVDKDELRARLIAQASDAKSKAEVAAEALALGRWGMIPPAVDLAALVLDLLTEQIAGYYDPDTKKLTVSKSAVDDPAWAEMVQAHEIDHGLQDQSFDLKKYEDVPDTEGDAQLARRAVVEGDGIAVMIEVTLARQKIAVDWSAPDAAAMIEKDMGTPAGAGPAGVGSAGVGGDQFDRAPLAVRESMIFPYRAGFGFVAALRHHNPWTSVDAAFKKPPRSTEQIIHPERYLAGDEPVPVQVSVPAALRGWTFGVSTVWGELGFDLFLRAHGVDLSVAAEAAAGWGGDRMVVLVKSGDPSPEHAIGLARMEWDSEADAIEAAEAATRAMDHATAGATVDHAETRTRWLALDGTVSWVERRGPSLVLVRGAPASLAEALATDVWTSTGPAAPPTTRIRPPKR
jgi:hypothetical protein